MSLVDRVLPTASHRREVVKALARSARRPALAGTLLGAHNRRELWHFRRTTIHCTVCGSTGRVLFELQDLQRLREHRIGLRRETLRCRACRAKMRDRTLAAGLLDAVADLTGVRATSLAELAERWPPGLRVLETDATSRIARRLAGCPGLTCSLYVDGRSSGEVLDDDGTVNVDLEQMPFDDASFDVVLTTEVMEHVRHPERAHREIARCLAPGGRYVFTVPYDAALARTWQLIDPVSDEPLVWPMHLHGDPELRPEGIKSYRVFGRDLVDDLAAAGLEGRFAPVDRPADGIFDGDLFVATPATGSGT